MVTMSSNVYSYIHYCSYTFSLSCLCLVHTQSAAFNVTHSEKVSQHVVKTFGVHCHRDIQWPSNSPELIAADFLWGIWKLKFLLTPSLTLTALKMQFVRRLRMFAGHCTSHQGKCTWEMAAMPWLSWWTSPRRCIEDVRLFLVNIRHWLT
jgi:hypothetical protein